jgi:hypothetical protein
MPRCVLRRSLRLFFVDVLYLHVCVCACVCAMTSPHHVTHQSLGRSVGNVGFCVYCVQEAITDAKVAYTHAQAAEKQLIAALAQVKAAHAAAKSSEDQAVRAKAAAALASANLAVTQAAQHAAEQHAAVARAKEQLVQVQAALKVCLAVSLCRGGLFLMYDGV